MNNLLPALQSPLYLITKLEGQRATSGHRQVFAANGMQGDWIMLPVHGKGCGDRLLLTVIQGGFVPPPAMSHLVTISGITMIEYAIIAHDGNQLIRQDYHHDFKKRSPAHISGGMLFAQWETQPLAFLLKSQRITAHAKGIQFVS